MLDDMGHVDYCFHHNVWCDPGSVPDCAAFNQYAETRMKRLKKLIRRVDRKLALDDGTDKSLPFLKVANQ